MKRESLFVFQKLPIRQKLTWVYTLLISIANASIEIVISLMAGLLISAALSESKREFSIPMFGNIQEESLVAGFAILIFIKLLLNIFEIRLKAHFTTDSIKFFSSKILERILLADNSKKATTSELHVSIIDDTNYTFRSYFYGMMNLISDTIAALSLVSIALISQPRLTLIFIMIFGVTVIPMSLWINRSQVQLNQRLQSASNDIYSLIKKTIEIRNEIYLYKKVKDFMYMFEKLRYSKASLEAESISKSNYVRISIEISFLLCIATFALAYNTEDALRNFEERFFVFVFCILRVVPLFGRITNSWSSMKSGYPSLKSLAQILPAIETERTNGPVSQVTEFSESLTLRNVYYKFDDAETANLERVNLTIRNGDKIAIVGGSGAGKSLLIDLLLGLRKPTCGVIEIDGKSLSETRAWSPFVGYVSQNYEIFDYSLSQAVTFDFKSNFVDFPRLTSIIKILGLELSTIDRLVSDISNREFSGKLSGGQIQRIAVARALYSESNFIVLDEATSNLDTETANTIIDALLKSDRTVILITHKYSEARKFNRIIRLDNRTLIEEK